MRILSDYHHHALAESLAILFVDRYGAELLFPAGMAWYDEELWQFERAWHGDRVARQYLEGIWAGATERDGYLEKADPRHPGRIIRGVTLERARELRFDLVLSTLPHNDEGFHRFASETGARFGVQIGNDHQQSRLDLATFVLASSTLPGLEQETADPASWGRIFAYRDVPTVVYHQAFSLETFRPGRPDEAERDVIASFVNCFPETPIYPGFLEMARRWSSDFRWRVFGSYGSAPTDELAAGDVSLVPDVAAAMRATRIGWHSKYWSDGFGHVIHNWFAVGRPVVGSARYYRGKLAGPLWVEGETSWDVDRYSDDELLSILRRLRDDDELFARACEASARRFREVVDLDREIEEIGTMLGL